MNRFTRPLRLFAALSLLAPMPGFAQEEDPKVGDVVQVFTVDLDQDGKDERIELRVVDVNEMGHTDRLVVLDATGDLLWEGPSFDIEQGFDNQAPVFGAWHFGVTDISLLTDLDLDKDGSIELLSAAPQSDVRPQSWRIFSWKNQSFIYMGMGCLIETAPGKFDFTADDSAGETWVSSLKLEKGDLLAGISQVKSGGEYYEGKARMKITRDGLEVLDWVEKLHKL